MSNNFMANGKLSRSRVAAIGCSDWLGAVLLMSVGFAFGFVFPHSPLNLTP
jgi:hypothetical protein